MSAPPRIDRAAIRRRDPAALATILVGQLAAYRCSTIYAPSVTRLDAFIREEALPRLRERLDVRAVVVEKWDKKLGPTVRQLVEQIYVQLELEPEVVEERPAAALERALRRAERRSDRPLLLVLYRLEQLLDKQRDPIEVTQFVEVLAHMAAMPMTGLHLVLGVREEDLGAFRELLRGRWRLLANDIRIRPEGKKWLLSVPLLVGAWISSNTAAVAAGAAACIGMGAGVGAGVGSQMCVATEDELAECRDERGRLRRAAAEAAPVPAPVPVPVPVPEPVPPASTTGEDATGTSVEPTGGTSGSDDTSTGPPAPTPAAPTKNDMCSPTRGDSACGKCVRSKCCADVKACGKSKWRSCVLKGQINQGDCLPEAIEKECRKLALCALENVCRPECFNH